MRWLVVSLITLLARLYQVVLSPVFHAIAGGPGGHVGCRFSPTCSQFSKEAVQTHGVLRGSGLAIKRMVRCHPWGGAGEDPVPRAISR